MLLPSGGGLRTLSLSGGKGVSLSSSGGLRYHRQEESYYTLSPLGGGLCYRRWEDGYVIAVGRRVTLSQLGYI